MHYKQLTLSAHVVLIYASEICDYLLIVVVIMQYFVTVD